MIMMILTTKRQNLRGNKPAQPALLIRPPEQVRDPAPPDRARRAARGGRVEVLESGEGPALCMIRGVFWVEFCRGFGELRLRREHALAAEVGELGDLVGKEFCRR